MSRHSQKKGHSMSIFRSDNENTQPVNTGFLGQPETLPPLEPPMPFAARAAAEPMEPYQRASAYSTEMTQYLSVVDRDTAIVMYAAVVRQMQTIRRAVEEAAMSDLAPGEFVQHINELLETYGRLHVVRSQMNETGIADRDVLGY